MDYFYEHESELFTFYRVPKVLFTEEPFKNMNYEAKLLYGLLLDKMELSRKNGWFDKQGRAFVYYGISHIKVICQIIDLANRHHIKTVILMACFSGRVCTNAVSIFSLPLLKFSIGGRSAFLGVELRLTYAVTHEQKRRDGNSGTESACG